VLRKKAPVSSKISGVAIKILLRTELLRIHEDAHHHQVRLPAAGFDKRKMSFMQIAHGRYKADALSLPSGF
jgi:hypothetical protein